MVLVDDLLATGLSHPYILSFSSHFNFVRLVLNNQCQICAKIEHMSCEL